MQHTFNIRELKNRRQDLRKRMTGPEAKLWSVLRARQIRGYKFRRQYGVEGFVVDFYCPELHVAIEIDGDSHGTNASEKADYVRQQRIESHNIQVLRFTNDDVMKNLNGVIEEIMRNVPEHTPSHLPTGQAGSP